MTHTSNKRYAVANLWLKDEMMQFGYTQSVCIVKASSEKEALEKAWKSGREEADTKGYELFEQVIVEVDDD